MWPFLRFTGFSMLIFFRRVFSHPQLFAMMRKKLNPVKKPPCILPSITLGRCPPAGRHGELLARQANASPHHHCQPGGAYSVVIMLRDQVAIFSGVCWLCRRILCLLLRRVSSGGDRPLQWWPHLKLQHGPACCLNCYRPHLGQERLGKTNHDWGWGQGDQLTMQ